MTGEVFVVVSDNGDLEVIDSIPQWEPMEGQRCYVANINGGDSLELPIVSAWQMPLVAWEDNPRFPVADWQYEVANGDTRLGYIEWLTHQEAT